MNTTTIKCSNCGATVDMDFDNMFTYCPYCQAKLMIDIENMEKIIAEREATKRAQEETKQKEIEFEYKNKENKRSLISNNFPIIIAFLIILLLFGSLYIPFDFNPADFFNRKSHIENNDIQLKVASYELKGKNYQDVNDIITKAGFTDVRLKEDDSFFKGLTKEDGEVESVSIDGKDYFKDTTWFSRDAVVVITYYP